MKITISTCEDDPRYSAAYSVEFSDDASRPTSQEYFSSLMDALYGSKPKSKDERKFVADEEC